MAKRFNTTGSCNPERHYMVNIDDKLKQIEAIIDEGLYFTINRARQFGKTTMMNFLYNRLSDEYLVYQISFESDGDLFESKPEFCRGLAMKLSRMPFTSQEQSDFWRSHNNCANLDEFSVAVTDFCKAQGKKVVLMIDEVDKSTDNQIFLHFLGMLRNKYLDRDKNGMDSTFHSVILAGVYDVKNLKLKIRNDEERKYNSPWNVAVRFNVDMTLSADGIKGMLDEYEGDYHTGMDTRAIANEIRRITSGYPVLVSYICSLIHEELQGNWTIEGVNKAAKVIIIGNNTLADDISKNLENNAELKEFMYTISVNGANYTYSLTNPPLRIADMFSYIKNVDGHTMMHNAIFEEIFHQYYTIEYEIEKFSGMAPVKSEYIINGKLNMEYVINRFKDLIEEEYRDEDAAFLERQGRLLFLCFLKPIINGTGYYYVEPQTRDNKRMDIVVNYDGEEYVIELKLWYGTKYERKGEDQVAEYANVRGLKKSYLITFAFLKEKLVQEEPEWKNVNGVDVYEGIIWAKKG
ncbi:MAG: AAA-like domain-containing protein [Paludibacteraceae bacterium]|nr:AAA-like domain-containing protein [Paludibacteraceae bacterium]